MKFGQAHDPTGLRLDGIWPPGFQGQSIYSSEFPALYRMSFNLQQVTYSSEHIDDFKKTYFVVNSLDESFTAPPGSP